MLYNKLFRLTLSLLIGFTPIHPDIFDINNDPVDFPFTRLNSVFVKQSYTVSDLGNNIPSDSAHQYVVTYHQDVYCSSACYFDTTGLSGHIADTGYNLTDTHLVRDYSIRISNKTPTVMNQLLSNISSSTYTAQGSTTYNDDNDIGSVTYTYKYAGSSAEQSGTQMVVFPALTQGMIDAENNYYLHEMSVYDWAIMDNTMWLVQYFKNLPPSVITTYQNYINNGDYSTANQYINNYLATNNTNEYNTNQTITNNFNTKNTNLNTLVQTENNFSTQIENDFQNRVSTITPNSNNDISQKATFINSANWVTMQFERLFFTSNKNAFALLLHFSLFLGFVMALIGKFR